jgi:hypothetical protein
MMDLNSDQIAGLILAWLASTRQPRAASGTEHGTP